MPKFILEESTYAGPIEDDMVFPAEVTAVKQIMSKGLKDDDGNPVPRVEFSFVITDPESPHDSTKLWGDTSITFSNNEKCKLYSWTMELLNADELPPGFELDTDDLIGLPCRIVVGARKKKKDGKETDEIANFVKDVLRPKGASVGAYAPSADEEPF